MHPTRRDVLEAVADGPVSGPELGDRLGVSRAAVWKHVEGLRDEGFEIESRSNGYELRAVPGYGPGIGLDLDAGFEVEYHDALPSTNDRARELAADGRTDVAVLADRQTGGRGRRGRAWTSPAGGVWLSVLLRPAVPPARAPAFTLAAAVATARTLREAGVEATIKWPNDVLVGERKAAGVLTEMEGEADRVSWLAVGIGVNANVDAAELPAGATSVRAEAGDADRRALAVGILESLDDLRNDLDRAVEDWRALSGTIGRRVRVETPDGPIVGEAVAVRFPGALVVETADGRVEVTTGDCEHLRPVE